MKRSLTLCVMLIVLIAISARSECGTDRWSIKTCTDDEAKKIVTKKDTTIDEMKKWPYPFPSKTEYPEGAQKKRVEPYETTIWTVDATLTELKMMRDGDIHALLTDEHGHVVVAELPDLECVKDNCPFYDQLSSVRNEMESKFNLKDDAKEHKVKVKVKISGVGLFARLYGKTENSEENLIQLHPVVAIKYEN